MDKRKIALKEGWQIPRRFAYVPYNQLSGEDRNYIESGEPYRLLDRATRVLALSGAARWLIDAECATLAAQYCQAAS